MEDRIVGFLLWIAVGLLFIGLGVAAHFAKKEVGFWSNVRPLPMEDVKGYNRAVGKLFIVYGLVAMVLGLPILFWQNSGGAVISILGIMLETIVAMAVYTISIQNKYEKK
ncbi:hypothetical protein [uncultured Acetatifactor sp.]|uniref:hypothetical protein n=1 Tax=uncultured Acetatifactor sp. TaxID=1671927 RepID=UPI0026113E38|nr:hypothetical protein [uncultured Acetatifactor sp.]